MFSFGTFLEVLDISSKLFNLIEFLQKFKFKFQVIQIIEKINRKTDIHVIEYKLWTYPGTDLS
jgi:hypothetical protein